MKPFFFLTAPRRFWTNLKTAVPQDLGVVPGVKNSRLLAVVSCFWTKILNDELGGYKHKAINLPRGGDRRASRASFLGGVGIRPPGGF